MPHFKRPRMVQTEQQVVYQNIILDPYFCSYSYSNPLPVYLENGMQEQVGEAHLVKAGHTLYGELRLNKTAITRTYILSYPLTWMAN